MAYCNQLELILPAWGKLNGFRTGTIALLTLMLLQLALTKLRAVEITNHFVFAHYMVCYDDYGDFGYANPDVDTNLTIAGYEQDIRDAQAAGIDGFALNCGQWDSPGSNPTYVNHTEMMYIAAERLGTGFKLFFSVDTTNLVDIVDMISSHANRTNSFRYQGKLVVSTSGQNGVDWQNKVFQPLQQAGINVFFVPYFYPDNGAPYTMAAVTNLLAKYTFLDGLFYFPAATPQYLTTVNEYYLLPCRGAGKLYMASYSPSYWGNAWPTNTGRPYYESQGGEGTMFEWMWIINNQPDWVEMTTWNDFNENTWCSPIVSPVQYESELSTPTRYGHGGYLELSKYYISWYKTGRQPPINQDSLYYFYRTHSTNAIASNTGPNDFPVTLFSNNGIVQDVIYTTTFLTSPAQLVVSSGDTLVTNSLPAGISSQRTPFAAGAQVISVLRDGIPVLLAQGPDILANITNYDYFTASGFAHGLNPPLMLSIQPQGNNGP
jgi:hypothetical protein